MKILFLNEYPSDRPVSGAEYSQKALADGLRFVKQKVIIYSPSWKKNQLGKGLSPLWFNQPIYYLYSAWQIYQKIKSEKIDLLHVHGKYILPGAVIAGWLTEKSVVTTVRDFKFLCPLALCFTNQQKTCQFNYFVNKEIQEYQQRYDFVPKWKLILSKLWQYQLKWWLNRCQQVIAVSPQLAKIYQNNGIKRVISIYNLPPKKQLRAQGKNILSVGKLSYGKGTDCLIKSAQLLPQHQFVFCGEINPSFKLKFPKNCHYLGKISHSETLQQYKKAAVFVILSRWPEPLSRAGLEALSFGLPIVASNRGGNQELIKDNGYLVDPEKPTDVIKALIKASQKSSILGINSQKLLVQRFNREKIIHQHLDLYTQILK